MPWRKALTFDGYMTEEELIWLYTQAQKMRSIIEIGSWCGRSTYVLCTGCKGPVYAIDHFKGSEEHQGRIERGFNPRTHFDLNLKDFNNVVVPYMSSEEASKSNLIPNEVDMVFIDGAHDTESVRTDLKLWAPRARKLVCGHDICEGRVKTAVEEIYPHFESINNLRVWKQEIV